MGGALKFFSCFVFISCLLYSRPEAPRAGEACSAWLASQLASLRDSSHGQLPS